MNEERIKACIARHPDWDSGRVANSLAVKIAEVEAIRGPVIPVRPGETIYPGHPKADPPAPAAAGLISLEKVKARYDIKAAIFREIGKLGKGKLISENDLAQRAAGNDRNRFRRTVENNADDFEPHRIKLRLDDSGDGKFYWGRREDIGEAKRIRDL